MDNTRSYLYLEALINEVPLSAMKRAEATAHLQKIQATEQKLLEKIGTFEDKLNETNEKMNNIRELHESRKAPAKPEPKKGKAQ